jgi:hypothetical protein
MSKSLVKNAKIVAKKYSIRRKKGFDFQKFLIHYKKTFLKDRTIFFSYLKNLIFDQLIVKFCFFL